MTTIFKIFRDLVKADQDGMLIQQVNHGDKEFHFQNWVRDRIAGVGFNFEEAGRNSYPDFHMVNFTEGYEVKGLAYPGC